MERWQSNNRNTQKIKSENARLQIGKDRFEKRETERERERERVRERVRETDRKHDTMNLSTKSYEGCSENIFPAMNFLSFLPRLVGKFFITMSGKLVA